MNYVSKSKMMGKSIELDQSRSRAGLSTSRMGNNKERYNSSFVDINFIQKCHVTQFDVEVQSKIDGSTIHQIRMFQV